MPSKTNETFRLCVQFFFFREFVSFIYAPRALSTSNLISCRTYASYYFFSLCLVELYVFFILLGHKSFDASSLFAAASMQSTRYKRDRRSNGLQQRKKTAIGWFLVNMKQDEERAEEEASGLCTSFSSVVRIKSNEKC